MYFNLPVDVSLMNLKLSTGMIGICSPLISSKIENQGGDAQPRDLNCDDHVLVAGGVNSFPYFPQLYDANLALELALISRT